MNNRKTMDALRKSVLFSVAPENLVTSVFEKNLCRTVFFETGDTVLSPDSESHELGILIGGKCSIFTQDIGHTTLLRRLSVGDVMGITRLFSDTVFPTRILAQTKCEVLFFSENAIREMMMKNTAFFDSYLSFLSGRIAFLNRKIGFLTAGSAERRLALYLGSFGKNELVLPDSVSALSDLLGLGRASLYRAFGKLENDGLIRRNGKSILISDPDLLVQKYKS